MVRQLLHNDTAHEISETNADVLIGYGVIELDPETGFFGLNDAMEHNMLVILNIFLDMAGDQPDDE